LQKVSNEKKENIALELQKNFIFDFLLFFLRNAKNYGQKKQEKIWFLHITIVNLKILD